MSSVEDLKKALDKFRDVLLDNDACDHILSEYDGFHDLFSVFQKDNMVVPRKQLFDKCAYVDFEGKPAIVCNLCRFYHGLQKGCSWEEEKKELFEATQK